VSNPGTVVAGRNHDRNSALSLFDRAVNNLFAFSIGQGKLLRIVRENAHSVGAAIDEIVNDSTLAMMVELLILEKNGGRDRKDSGDY
jgi:hypothetical protein